MRASGLPAASRRLRAFVVAVAAVAGLLMCLTVMHGSHAGHGDAVAAGSPVALAGQHAVQSVHGVATLTVAAECGSPYGESHQMIASQCEVALLAPLLLAGPAPLASSWRPVRQRILQFIQRWGSESPSRPPSLLLLSISRT